MPADPIEFELFKNALFSVADEMALTIFRTTYSGVLKDNMDYSTAMFDADGQLAAQGLTLPGHLGSMPTAMAAFREALCRRDLSGRRPDPERPVSKAACISPTSSSSSRSIMTGALLGYAGTVCHHTDVGGRVAGSNASDSTEIYQEGLRIPPLKLYDRGRRNDTLWALVERNVRVPVKVFGDLRAQLAACHIAEALALRPGQALRAGAAEAVNDRADPLFGAADARRDPRIAGRGLPLSRPYRRRRHRCRQADPARGHRSPSRASVSSVDWTGSSPQVKGAINNTLSFTKSASYCAIRSMLPADIPNNEGVFRAIEVIAPPGTIANAVLPAACAARGLTGFRMVDCLFGALAQMLPDGVRLLRRRQYRDLDRRLGPRPAALHLCRFHLLRLGRPALCRRARRQFEHFRQHGLAIDRGHRERAADRDHSPTNSSPTRWAPANSAAARRSAAITVSWPRRASCRCAPTGAIPPLRALWRRPRQAVDELSEPGAREPAAAVEIDDDDPPRRRVPPRGRRRRRLGRSVGARSGDGLARRQKRARLAGRGRAAITAWC